MHSSHPIRITRILPFVLFALFTSSLEMAAQTTNAEVEATLDKHLIANRQAKGTAAALADANGIRVVAAGFARDSVPVKAEDLFEIGSVTKALTGLAWMRLPFDQREIMNHDGCTFGSSSSLAVDRAAKEGVFIVTNSSTPLKDIAPHLMDRRHTLAPREFPKITAIGAEVLARYAGIYQLSEVMNIAVRI